MTRQCQLSTRKHEAIAALLLLFVSFYSQAQSSYDEGLLALKQRFTENAAIAIGEPYRGVATSAGIIAGLYPVQATGLSTSDLVSAAEKFLNTLTPAQLSHTQFGIGDPEWRNWSNVDVGIFPRQGVSLEGMTEPQKTAAWNLLSAALSAKGLELTRNVMRTEQTLFEISADAIRYDEEKYYFTVMGIPSAEKPWGFQLDGHHLVINYFVLGDQIVMTPTFMGGEPTVTKTGKYAGSSILQPEQDQGLAFMQALDSGQQKRATIKAEKTGNNNGAEANQDNLTLDYQGIKGSELTGAQKQQLLNLTSLYVGTMRAPHADVKMDEVGKHINDTYFAWVGSSEDDAVFYYRIHSPVVLIEFDHQNPVGTPMPAGASGPQRQHIHTVIRTPNGNDYGKDLLRQHLQSRPH